MTQAAFLKAAFFHFFSSLGSPCFPPESLFPVTGLLLTGSG